MRCPRIRRPQWRDVIAMLQILEHFDLAAAGHGTARHIDLVARAMAAAHTDRNEYLADPDFADVPVAMLTSKNVPASGRRRSRRVSS